MTKAKPIRNAVLVLQFALLSDAALSQTYQVPTYFPVPSYSQARNASASASVQHPTESILEQSTRSPNDIVDATHSILETSRPMPHAGLAENESAHTGLARTAAVGIGQSVANWRRSEPKTVSSMPVYSTQTPAGRHLPAHAVDRIWQPRLRMVAEETSLAELAIPPALLEAADQNLAKGENLEVVPLTPPPARDSSTAVSPAVTAPPVQANPIDKSQQEQLDRVPPVSESIQSLPPPATSAPGKVPRWEGLAPLQAIPDSLLKEYQRGSSQSGTVPATTPSQANSTSRPDIDGLPPTTGDLNGSSQAGSTSLSASAKPKQEYDGPVFYESYGSIKGPLADAVTQPAPYDPNAFAPDPIGVQPAGPGQDVIAYRGKSAVPVQRPLIELWRPLYTSGIYPPAKNWFGRYNPVMPHFMVYGDYRTAVASNRNVNGDADVWAHRLNLDMDLELTATERIHAFIGPLDRNGDFTRIDFTDDVEFLRRTDLRLDTLFFEGDAGAIWGGIADHDSTFDLPFSFGLLPLFYQNGIWAADAVVGAAVALPAKHSKLLKWSNYDATFFWASDQVTTDAFAGDNNAAEFFGTAWFIEAYDGYIETDYAFVHDDVGGHRSYHNLSVAFSRRYLHRVSNSVRFITNFGQSLPADERTADGHLLLIENSLISHAPNTFVPYWNIFYGQGRTQSLARAAGVGGILNNTGINFETDGLTGYPTLDPTGVNTVGFAVGLNMLGENFEQQLVVELAGLSANGSDQFRNAAGDQYAAGVRYQRPLNNFLIFRTDAMYGWLRDAPDIHGTRMELRWKF